MWVLYNLMNPPPKTLLNYIIQCFEQLGPGFIRRNMVLTFPAVVTSTIILLRLKSSLNSSSSSSSSVSSTSSSDGWWCFTPLRRWTCWVINVWKRKVNYCIHEPLYWKMHNLYHLCTKRTKVDNSEIIVNQSCCFFSLNFIFTIYIF